MPKPRKKPSVRTQPTTPAWLNVVEAVGPYVVRLKTQRGWGTGFLLGHSHGQTLAGVVTAAHVIQDAHQWEDPIRVEHPPSGDSILLHEADRAITLDQERDTAVVVFHAALLPSLPATTMNLAPVGRHLRVANEVGWLGFPAVATGMCFFSGKVSAWLESTQEYLVDGNAINGVSGGPAFHAFPNGQFDLVGLVLAYIPNRQRGEALPGLAVIRSVEHLHTHLSDLNSLGQAKAEETPSAAAADSGTPFANVPEAATPPASTEPTPPATKEGPQAPEGNPTRGSGGRKR